MIIADLLAGLAVDEVFARPADFSSWDLLIALYGYTFQIYNDFSGYSDIAIGVACVFGFSLPINFNRPYLALNIRDFWNRWHISLSTWFRDYLYIPLGGSRVGKTRICANLMVTMFLCGLWHGAAMNFVIWGVYHGFLLLAYHIIKGDLKKESSWPPIVSRIICFHFVVFGWLIFRINDMGLFKTYILSMSKLASGTSIHPLYYLVLLLAILFHFIPKAIFDKIATKLTSSAAPIQATVYTLLILLFWGITLEGPQFIYFQF